LIQFKKSATGFFLSTAALQAVDLILVFPGKKIDEYFMQKNAVPQMGYVLFLKRTSFGGCFVFPLLKSDYTP